MVFRNLRVEAPAGTKMCAKMGDSAFSAVAHFDTHVSFKDCLLFP